MIQDVLKAGYVLYLAGKGKSVKQIANELRRIGQTVPERKGEEGIEQTIRRVLAWSEEQKRVTESRKRDQAIRLEKRKRREAEDRANALNKVRQGPNITRRIFRRPKRDDVAELQARADKAII